MLTATGTHALTLALRAACVRQGSDLVALPAYSCYDLVTAATGAGSRIVFYDIDPDTLSPDLASLERALTAGAATVVAAPAYGVPLDWRAVTALVRVAGAVLIEDAAQAHGAAHEGRVSGSWGDLAVLSFGRGKGWTGGGGGALLVPDGGWAGTLETLISGIPQIGRSGNWLRAAAACALGRPTTYAIPAAMPWLRLGQTIYRDPSPESLMDETTAGLLLATREAATRDVGARRTLAATYRAHLGSNARWRHISPHPDSAPSWLRYPLRITEGSRTAHSPRYRRQGIAAGYPRMLPELPAAVQRVAVPQSCPGAAELVLTLITLPTHSRVRTDDADAICRLLTEMPGGRTSRVLIGSDEAAVT